MQRKIQWKPLILSILLTQAVGGAAFLAAGKIKPDYLALPKPPLAAPHWLFGIAWPVLYLLMAIAAYIVYTKIEHGTGRYKSGRLLYLSQLFLNIAWTWLFFRMGMHWAAAVVLLLILILALVCTVIFARIRRAAGWLLAPYTLWLCYATYLNISIALLTTR